MERVKRRIKDDKEVGGMDKMIFLACTKLPKNIKQCSQY